MNFLERAARMLRELALMGEVLGENPFSLRSYRRAAEALEGYLGSGDKSDWRSLSGIGKKICQLIEEVREKGTSELYHQWRQQLPREVFLFLRLPGLGPKKLKSLLDHFEFQTLEELEELVKQEKVRSVRGFGPKMEAKLLEGISFLYSLRSKTLLWHAWEEADLVERQFLERGVVLHPTGELRRGAEVVSQLEYLWIGAEEQFSELASVVQGKREGDVLSWQTSSGLTVKVYCVSEPQFPTFWIYTSAAEDHWKALQQRAEARGLELRPTGLLQKNKALKLEDEADLYRALDLEWIPPELRESGEEIPFTEKGRLAELVELEDLMYLYHNHTDWSDGRAPLERMVEAAMTWGAKGISINDHSQAASYAGGLDAARLTEQIEYIQTLRPKVAPFEVFSGIEVDILPDGTLDLDEEILQRLDVVVASVHSHFQQDEKSMTERILKALESPFVHILGHPTGQLHLQRPGYALDLAAVLTCCQEQGKGVELNANPYRLDLSWQWLRAFPQLSVALNGDCHAVGHFDYLHLGLLFARKGLVTKGQLLNRTKPPWKKTD